MSTELPPPTAELVIARVAIEAFLDVMGPKKGERFLKGMAERLTVEERLSEILPIRPASDAARVTKARREAAAWFRQSMPRFMGRL